MEQYWDSRFLAEGKVWGDAPSKTAVHAGGLFREKRVRKVLVPGAGYGRNTAFLVANGFAVDGIELSGEALRLAAVHDPVTRFFKGSVLDMPFSAEIYDAVYCFNVLHLFGEADRRRFIGKCRDQMATRGLAFFTVFSEKEPSLGKGRQSEPNTFESKPGRPVHYFTHKDLTAHFKGFNVLETGLMEDAENHGAEGPHVHMVRYIFTERAD